MLISAITYYYFGDEIKIYSISLWDRLRGRRPGNDGNDGNATNNANLNPVSSYFGLNRNNGLFSQFVADEDSTDVIEVVNEASKGKDITRNLEKAVAFVDQSKPIPRSFTSPSLDNLNSSVAETWSNTRASSPESVSSSSTIKPSSLPKIKVDTNVSASTDLPPSDATLPKTPEGYIDEALTPNEIKFKPFVEVEEINGKLQYVYNEANWKSFLNKGVSDRMNWVETALSKENLKNLDKETTIKLQEKSNEITMAYNAYVSAYQSQREKFDNETVQPLKNFGYLMRHWLNKHLNLIWPDENINI